MCQECSEMKCNHGDVCGLPVYCEPSIEECIEIIAQLVGATRRTAVATKSESMVVRVARRRAEKFLCGTGFGKANGHGEG
jgi:hypothetical protein